MRGQHLLPGLEGQNRQQKNDSESADNSLAHKPLFPLELASVVFEAGKTPLPFAIACPHWETGAQ